MGKARRVAAGWKLTSTVLGFALGASACAGRSDASKADAGDAAIDPCVRGTVSCGSVCTVLENDPENCGACGHRCSVGSACVSGTCSLLAPPPDGSSGDASAPTGDGAAPLEASATPDGAAIETAPDAQSDAAPAESCDACAASNWRMFGHDPQHSGANLDELGVPPPVAGWSASLLSKTALSPAVVEDDRVFVSSDAVSFASTTPVFAVNAADGSRIWSYDFGRIGSAGQPSVANGTLYIQTVGASEDCYLWAMDATTGALTWRAPFTSQWAHFWAPTVAGDAVYINGGEYGGLYAFVTADGSQRFFDDSLGQYDAWSPAFFDGAVYTFVAGTFQASDPGSGAALWSTTIPWNGSTYSMNTSPVFSSTLAYVVAPPNLVAIDPVAKKTAWTSNAAYTGTPAVAAGVVYATTAGTLTARDATSGALLWSFLGDGSLSYPPAVTAGYVYVASSANVYAVRISDHQQVWTAPVGGWVTVAAGVLLVAGSDGTLHGYVLARP